MLSSFRGALRGEGDLAQLFFIGGEGNLFTVYIVMPSPGPRFLSASRIPTPDDYGIGLSAFGCFFVVRW